MTLSAVMLDLFFLCFSRRKALRTDLSHCINLKRIALHEEQWTAVENVCSQMVISQAKLLSPATCAPAR
jgi:hypothetical protein